MASELHGSSASASVSSETLSSKHRKSDVWKHFRKTELKGTLCEKTYAFHGGLSNLRDHLVRRHASEFKPWFNVNYDIILLNVCPLLLLECLQCIRSGTSYEHPKAQCAQATGALVIVATMGQCGRVAKGAPCM